VTRQENLYSERDCYRVLATDNENQSYFIMRVKAKGIANDDYCWCSTNQPVALGELLEGYLKPSPDLGTIPTLIIK